MLDGRRGLVPSNFVEKLEGEELFDFHQQVVLGLGTIHILRNHFQDGVSKMPKNVLVMSKNVQKYLQMSTKVNKGPKRS
jgi:hypothetical protein